MTVTGISKGWTVNERDFYRKSSINAGTFTEAISAAFEKAEVQEGGKLIGFGTIMEPGKNRGWCMTARYAEASTPENPVIHVETNYGGKTAAYNISINKINPGNASRLELFALGSYADNQGTGCGSTFGTYNILIGFADMAVHNGYFGAGTEAGDAWERFSNEKLNWRMACSQLAELFFNCGDMLQYRYGMKIINLFSKYPSI